MELKVWVDGIQRVVCGASYSTTCQDVVLALAHAMGRTGRFTLVEKWRDSERPLTPGECPLQSLHKWGEYAAEVRFYLVQAETEKVKQLQQTRHRENSPGDKREQFTHNFTPPQPSPHLLSPGSTDSIKRSSTFSGAHNMNYANMSSSSMSSSKSGDGSHYSRNQGYQPPPSSLNTATSGNVPRTSLGPLPNGEVPGLSSASSSGSSPRSPSRSSPRAGPPPAGSRGYASSSGMPGMYRGDARAIHPANMPGASSQYSNQTRDYSPSPRQQQQQQQQQPHQFSSSQHRRPGPQQSSHPPPPHHHHHQLYPGQPHTARYQYPAQQKQPQSSQYSTSSGLDHSHSTTVQQQPSQPHPQQVQPSTQRLHLPGGQSQPPSFPVPAPRHLRTSPSAVEYENLPPRPQDRRLPPQRRERSRERRSQKPVGYNQTDAYGTQQDNSAALGNQEAVAGNYNYPYPQAERDNVYIHSNREDGNQSHGRNYPDQWSRAPYGNASNIYDNNTQGRSRSNDGLRTHADSSSDNWKSSTLDRQRLPKPQPSQGMPSRSLSTGAAEDRDHAVVRSSDEGQQPLSRSLPASSMNQLKQSGEGNRMDFVESAIMKKVRSSGESRGSQGGGGGGGGKAMSSFASAVAHLRQHNNDIVLKLPKSEAHVRQHSSDSSKTDSSFKPGLGQNVKDATLPEPLSSSLSSSSGIPSHDSSAFSEHQQKEQHSSHYNVQPSNLHDKPSSAFNPLSSPRHNSAFTEVSPRTSRQGSSSSPQAAPVPYNLENQNFDHYGGDLRSLGKGVAPQAPESSHSRQASLEIEEYDLDQNFPDVHHRDSGHTHPGAGKPGGGGGGGAGNRPNMPLEYHLESGDVAPSHSEAKYMQLMRMIKMQQERIKMQEAQINDKDMEISRLEEIDSNEKSKLEVITLEVSELEKQEGEVAMELEDIERVEWINVLDGEKKREADIKQQMIGLKEQIEQIDSQLKQLKEEEEKKTAEIKIEEERVSAGNRKMEELERKNASEMKQLNEKLSSLDKANEENEKKLKELEGQIVKADKDLKQQEEKAKSLEVDLKDENLKGFQAHPVPKEPPPTSVPDHTPITPVTSAAPQTPTFSAPESGEAILKILEGRLSPRNSPVSPSGDGSGVGGLTSAQHTYKSAMAVKNPNGVWV